MIGQNTHQKVTRKFASPCQSWNTYVQSSPEKFIYDGYVEMTSNIMTQDAMLSFEYDGFVVREPYPTVNE